MRAICSSALAAFALLATACDSGGGDSHDKPPAPPIPEPTVLLATQSAPGVHVAIVSIGGGSGSDGSLRVGDRVRVRFTLTKDDGSPWGLAEMVHSSAMVSGPSFNYQRVIAEQTDVVERATAEPDGSFVYAFATGIPAHYIAPYNDTPSFGPGDGELTGDDLLAGTYTIGLSLAWDYTVDGVPYHDVGETTGDILFGGAATLQHRQVTKLENCNQCHVSLRAHEDLRRSVEVCVLCHTSGAEDANDPMLAAGTPGRSIDFKVMNHKIHNARHLPSVVGIGTHPDGTLDYSVAGRPYVLADSITGVRDYSNIGFPVWPNRTIPMPRDFGYSSLSASEQAKEDLVRTGVTTCEVCHGDPDGAGPLTAPAEGDLVYAQSTARSCVACHDDVDLTRDYTVNQQTMQAAPFNDLCTDCHAADGAGQFNALAIKDGHMHPLRNALYTGATFVDFTTFDGLNLQLASIAESGASDGDGTIDVGEKIAVTMTLKTDASANFPTNKVASLSVVVAGPTSNSNIVLETAIPRAMLAGAQPFSFLLPEQVQLELVGHSTAVLGDVFTTARTPHFNVVGAKTAVLVRTATAGGASALGAAANAPQNFVDVADSTGFARDDYVVIDDGTASEEYARVQFVDGNRLWFSSPETPGYKAGTQLDHAAGATVLEVTLVTKALNTYDLDAPSGTITELTEFGAGNAVLVNYLTEFVMPARYPIAQNDSPDLEETCGEWRGKSLVPGTYTVTMWAGADLDFNSQGEDNLYRYTSQPSALDVRVADATTDEPYALISSGSNCYACHRELDFHGGTARDFESCIACHGNAGAEDRPRYVAANAPDTTGVTVNFRTLLHQIHRGADLAHASTFTAVDSAATPYPDNFALNKFDDVFFPAMPGKTAQCSKCHGATNTAWIEPAPRDHPTEQGQPVRAWRAVCATCHDSAAASAHFDLRTSGGGVEACEVCHAPGTERSVERAHAVR